jgi:hypothetical protein
MIQTYAPCLSFFFFWTATAQPQATMEKLGHMDRAPHLRVCRQGYVIPGVESSV